MEKSKLLEQVIKDLTEREVKGIASYGTTMDRTDLSQQEWLQHLYEELLDAALYTKKLLTLLPKQSARLDFMDFSQKPKI